MKYLMQILLGLILLQLLQSCDYSKSRDVLWMKKNFENNAELFFDVTNLFNNSIPINLKKENYVNFNINDKNNSVDIIIISKNVINGERVTQKANSQRLDNKNFNLSSIPQLFQKIACWTQNCYYDVLGLYLNAVFLVTSHFFPLPHNAT